MGIFSSKLKTYVGSSISRFADSSKFISSKTRGAISGINRNEDITEHTLEHLVKSHGFNAKKAFAYGNTYTFGRPDDTLITKSGSSSAVYSAIVSYVNALGGSSVFYGIYGANNYYHKIYKILIDLLKFNLTTQELVTLSASKGHTVTLHSVSLLSISDNSVDDTSSFNPIGLGSLNLNVILDDSVSRVGTEITYRWVYSENVPLDVTEIVSGLTELNSVSETYAGGTVDFTTTTESAREFVSDGSSTSTLSPLPQELPLYYADTTRVLATEYTLYRVVVTTVTYVASTTTRTTTISEKFIYVGTGYTTYTYHRQESIKETNIAFSNAELNEPLLMSAYVGLDGKTKFLDHIIGSGAEPEEVLNTIFNTTYSTPGEYLPFLYFRWDYKAGNEILTSTEYLHSKELARKIGITYDKVIDAVHKIDENRTQEDLDKVISSLLLYALPADSSDSVEISYLYDHFKKWHNYYSGKLSDDTLEVFNTSLTFSDLAESVIVIEDKRFKMTVGFQGIWKRVVDESLKIGLEDAPIGTYQLKKGVLTVTSLLDESITLSREFPYYCYRLQTGEAEYTEYQVVGIECKYYMSVNDKNDYHSFSKYTEDPNDASDLVYIPIDYTIVSSYPVFKQEELIYKSMQIINNSVQIVKIEWYQRSGWGTAFKIAAIVAALQGFTEALSFVNALIAVASVSIAWALEIIYTTVLDALIAAISVQVFVNVAGDDLAFLAAMFLMINGASGNYFGLNLGTATEVMSYANSIFKEISDNFTKEYQSLKNEYISIIEKQKTVLNEISSLIGDLVNPNQKLGLIALNETPAMVFNKIHQGNIGTKAFDLLHNYVDISLDLPRAPAIRI